MRKKYIKTSGYRRKTKLHNSPNIVVNIYQEQNTKQPYTTERNFKMIKLNRDLCQITNYFIYLYFATDKKYHCTRTKLSKLVSILAFIYARDGVELFENKIYKYDKCGTIIQEIKMLYDMVMYENVRSENTKNLIKEPIIHSDNIPKKYLDFDDLTDDIKCRIEDVFRHFGSYSPFALGQCLNQIVDYPDIIKEDKSFDLLMFSNLKKDDFINISENRELIDYLF